MDDLQRRDFLRHGLVAGAAVATGLAEPEALASHAPFDAGSFLERCDQQLDGIRQRHTLGRLVPEVPAARSPEEEAAHRRVEELLHSAMRSLLFVSMLRDVPQEELGHAGIQARIEAMLPEMDTAFYGLQDLMTSLSPADRIDLRDALRDDPQLAMRVVEALDAEGAAAGVPAKRRLHLRSVASQVVWRLSHQSPGAVVDEYVRRSERFVVARGGQLDGAEQLRARLANEVLFLGGVLGGGRDEGARGARVAQAEPGMVVPPPDATKGAPATPVEVEAPPTFAEDPVVKEEQQRQARLRKADRLIKAGGIVLGVALGLDAIGLGLVAAGQVIPALFLFTPGALGLLAGLIILIVGAAKRAANTP